VNSPQLDYAVRLIVELENLLFVQVPDDVVWPKEVSLIFDQTPGAVILSLEQQARLRHHINRMWLERMPVPSITNAAGALAVALGDHK
jgi:hypothetical protein